MRYFSHDVQANCHRGLVEVLEAGKIAFQDGKAKISVIAILPDKWKSSTVVQVLNFDELINCTANRGLLGEHFRYGAQLVQPGEAAEQEAEVLAASLLR